MGKATEEHDGLWSLLLETYTSQGYIQRWNFLFATVALEPRICPESSTGQVVDESERAGQN